MSTRSFWARILHAAKDFSFIFGALMVAALLTIAILGPEIAPHNPYQIQRIQWIDGELDRAPIAPNSMYPLGTDPLGRDILSLLLYGARTTLVIALLATTVRILFGLVLGALAGWRPGGVIDRLVTVMAGFFAAIPGLILAILIVYAVGIREGQIAFVIALSIVGWGEVAQIFRSHVFDIRKESFIEAAQAVGLSSIEILSRHVLPNLLSTMLALISLEMANALLLLGELGFVNVFLGSGAFLPGDPFMANVLTFEIPDWGAMLGTNWRSFRALPWLPGAPAVAFFVSILSFNLFGYGLQRFSERGRFYPSGLSVLRFVSIVVAILFGVQYVLSITGPESAYKDLARDFNIQRAWNDISFLTKGELGGRATGTEGRDLAASYISRQFSEAGLTPFPTGTYFQTYPVQHGHVTAMPVIELLDPNGEVLFTLRDGLYFDPNNPFEFTGEFEDGLAILGNNNYYTSRFSGGFFFIVGAEQERLRPEDVVLGIRIIPDDRVPKVNIAPQFLGPLAFLGTEPTLLMSESAARNLITDLGYDLDALSLTLEEQEQVWIETNIPVRVRVGLEYEQVAGVNVLGYIPGEDVRVQTQRVLVAAPYAGPSPIGNIIYPGADENASGVAIMLEVLRRWREIDFKPDHTVVFAAFDENGGENFVLEPILPTGATDTWSAVILYGLGAGDNGNLSRIQTGGALETVFDESGRTMGVPTEPLNYWPFFFSGGGGRSWDLPADPSYSGIAVTRPGDEYSNTPLDSVDHLDPKYIEEAGRALSHFLMVISSE
ncbi:MAG: ABC transporter permease subunit [Anaerolineales bacterium]|nr:MAG: ABC transporter permease subunit [Anaerolineales bacterium]